MTLAEAATAFTALFVIIDPIGLAPIFVAMTAGMTARARRAIAIRACLIAAREQREARRLSPGA